jgi:thiamine-monophosphate kinase
MASRPWRKAISTINEFDLIRALQRRYRSDGPGVLRGIGDDAAVIASEPRRSHLFTTDLLAEGIHFDLASATFVDLGFRAATANLSDIAAMGGTPEYILVSLAMPLYVTGTLGDSRAGLQLLQDSPRRSRPSISFRHRRFLVTRHLRPTARIREGCWLARGRWATSAIDISDGLSGDLRHLCEASQVGVDLDLSMLPISPACRAYAHGVNQDPAMVALAGGEDYELLFTVPSRRSARFEQATRAHRIQVTRVGRMLPRSRGLHMIMPSGRRQPLPLISYEHFRSQR